MPVATPAQVFQVGSYDIAKFSEAELWARLNQLTRFYATMAEPIRLLAYSRPYPLDEPLDRVKELLTEAPTPRAREQLVAYRRFVEQIVESAYLKDTTYYVQTWSKRQPHVLAAILANGLGLPTRHAPRLPDLLTEPYAEAVDHVYPANHKSSTTRRNSRSPYVAFLYSYDLRGQIGLETSIHFLQLPFPVYMAVDVQTIHPVKATRTLQMAYNKLRADLGNTGTAPDPEKEQAFVDVQQAMHEFNDQRLGIHQVVLGFAVTADNRDGLHERVELLRATAERNQIYLRPAWWHQRDAYTFFTSRPLPETVARESRNVLSPGIPCLLSHGYETPRNTDGPFVAINLNTGSPLWLDKFSLVAYNEIVLGRTGSGKTFMAGLRAYREARFGVQTIVIDPQGNFRKLTEAVEGQYNALRLGAGTALNILDVVHDHPAQQVSHVVVLLEALLGRPLNTIEKGGVDSALLGLYSGMDLVHRRSGGQVRVLDGTPLLEDLAHALRGKDGDYQASLATELERFVDGSLREIFNAPTTLGFDLDRRYPVITFDVSELEGEFQPALVFALLSAIERAIRSRRAEQKPTNILLDEFFILSQIPTLARAAGMLAKRVRAWKVGIQCLDQNWATFDTAAGRQILENALIKVIMRVDDTAAPAIVRNLGLTGHHAEVILSAQQGEGILIVENKPYHVYFQAGPDEVEMLTPYTRPAEEAFQLPVR